jgi:hypothetical protein
MAVDYNNALAKAILDRYDTEFPAGSLLQLRTGAPPGADAAATGTLLVEITLPATPWSAAVDGASKGKNGTWSDVGVAAGTIGHFRLKNAGDTKREEGTVTATGGGGDMTVDNTSVAIGQTVTVNSYTKTL